MDVRKLKAALKKAAEVESLEEECDDPGNKKRSKGKGRGAGKGKGKGPVGSPFLDKEAAALTQQATGAIGGGLAGGLLGYILADRKNKLKSTLQGAGVGALAGSAYPSVLDAYHGYQDESKTIKSVNRDLDRLPAGDHAQQTRISPLRKLLQQRQQKLPLSYMGQAIKDTATLGYGG